jgi:hypothetical protein
MNGIEVSSYSQAQLAAMLQSQTAGTSPTLLGNQPYAAVAPASSGTPAPAAGSYSAGVRLTNQSGGSNSSFNVGDSWQIIVTGPPNAQVTANATQNGAVFGTNTPMGTIGSNGQLVLSGTFTASEAGTWNETWMVGGQSAGSISFAVAAPGGSSAGGGSTGGGGTTGGGGSSTSSSSSSSSDFGFLTNTFSIFGVSIPVWAAGAAGLAALYLFSGRKWEMIFLLFLISLGVILYAIKFDISTTDGVEESQSDDDGMPGEADKKGTL